MKLIFAQPLAIKLNMVQGTTEMKLILAKDSDTRVQRELLQHCWHQTSEDGVHLGEVIVAVLDVLHPDNVLFLIDNAPEVVFFNWCYCYEDYVTKHHSDINEVVWAAIEKATLERYNNTSAGRVGIAFSRLGDTCMKEEFAFKPSPLDNFTNTTARANTEISKLKDQLDKELTDLGYSKIDNNKELEQLDADTKGLGGSMLKAWEFSAFDIMEVYKGHPMQDVKLITDKPVILKRTLGVWEVCAVNESIGTLNGLGIETDNEVLCISNSYDGSDILTKRRLGKLRPQVTLEHLNDFLDSDVPINVDLKVEASVDGFLDFLVLLGSGEYKHYRKAHNQYDLLQENH